MSRGPLRRHVERGGGPANSEFQAAAIGRVFHQLNPDADAQEIDVDSTLDPSLHIDENIEVFERRYPQYLWRAEERN